MYYSKETGNNKIKIVLSSESAIDLPKRFLQELKISTVDMKICLNDLIVSDSKTVPETIIDFVNSTGMLPKTSAINCQEYLKHFKKLLTKNKEDALVPYVIHFSLSSKLSSSYNNAVEAAKKCNGKVIVIDTKTLSTGIALLIMAFKKCLEQTEYLVDALVQLDRLIEKVNASLVIEKLKYLKMGGRCSSLVSFGANILKIKPQIIMREGSMHLGKPFRGSLENVLYKYCKEVELNLERINLENIFITYTAINPDIIINIKALLKSMGFKNIYITQAGGTITSHCGENCLGLLYMNK
jgi:DegV family protein with EDD domain